MTVTPITDAKFKATLAEDDKLVFIDFWAPWCGPCRQVAPIVEEVAKELADEVSFYSLDVDENPVAAAELNITSIPALKVFRKGEEVGALIGAHPKNAIKNLLASV